MSASVGSLRSQIAAARPENKRQVSFAMARDDTESAPPSCVHSSDSGFNVNVAAGACDGHPSRARRLSPDDPIERFGSGGNYSVQVRNTFIELLEEGGEASDGEQEDQQSRT